MLLVIYEKVEFNFNLHEDCQKCSRYYFFKCEMVHETNFSLKSAKQHGPLWPIWISTFDLVMVSVVSSIPSGVLKILNLLM